LIQLFIENNFFSKDLVGVYLKGVLKCQTQNLKYIIYNMIVIASMLAALWFFPNQPKLNTCGYLIPYLDEISKNLYY